MKSESTRPVSTQGHCKLPVHVQTTPSPPLQTQKPSLQNHRRRKHGKSPWAEDVKRMRSPPAPNAGACPTWILAESTFHQPAPNHVHAELPTVESQLSPPKTTSTPRLEKRTQPSPPTLTHLSRCASVNRVQSRSEKGASTESKLYGMTLPM